jgi:hypothetical protein
MYYDISSICLYWLMLCASMATCETKIQVPTTLAGHARALQTSFTFNTSSTCTQSTRLGKVDTPPSHVAKMVSTNITTSTIVAKEACTENNNLEISHSSQPTPLRTIVQPQNDIGTLVRTILFEILGLLIGAATLFVAIIAIRAKKPQSEIESGPCEQHELPSLPDVHLGRDEQLLESGMTLPTPSILTEDVELPE